MGPDEAEVPHILALSLWVHSEREKLQYVSFCSFIPFSQPMQSMGMGVGKRPGERVESRQLGCIISGGSQRYALMLTHCCVTLGTTLPSLGLDVPVEVKSASMCEALLAVSPLFFFLLACFGVTFLLEDEWGIGRLRPLLQTRESRRLVVWVVLSPTGPLLSSLPPLKALAVIGRSSKV